MTEPGQPIPPTPSRPAGSVVDYAPAGQRDPTAVARTSLLWGILSIPLLIVCGTGLIAAIAAIVMGIDGYKHLSHAPGSRGRHMAIWGILLGLVACLVFGTCVVASL